jgi:hypothetical protein
MWYVYFCLKGYDVMKIYSFLINFLTKRTTNFKCGIALFLPQNQKNSAKILKEVKN